MMNEQIKKLKEQATSYTWNGNGVTEELDEEKFAELLVRESGRVLNSYGSTVGWAADILKEHFGVE